VELEPCRLMFTRKVSELVRIFPTLDLIVEEQATRR
jgi:hypothetical protein